MWEWGESEEERLYAGLQVTAWLTTKSKCSEVSVKVSNVIFCSYCIKCCKFPLTQKASVTTTQLWCLLQSLSCVVLLVCKAGLRSTLSPVVCMSWLRSWCVILQTMKGCGSLCAPFLPCILPRAGWGGCGWEHPWVVCRGKNALLGDVAAVMKYILGQLKGGKSHICVSKNK